MLALFYLALALIALTHAAPHRRAPPGLPPLSTAQLEAQADKTRSAIAAAAAEGISLTDSPPIIERRQAPSNLITITLPPVPTPTQTGRIQLTYSPSFAAWTGPFSVGTPGQTFQVLFDTGSSDTWVTSTSCTSGFCSSKAKYDATSSSTSVTTSTHVTLTYTSGTNGGFITNDTTGAGSLSVPSYTFIAADTLDAITAAEPESGIVGLGFAATTAPGLTPWFDKLIDTGSLASNVFSFHLSTSGGELILGGTDTSRYVPSSLTWIDNGSPVIWYALATSARLGGVEFAAGFIGGFDTGTSYILGDPTAVAAFYAQVPGAVAYDNNWWLYDCDSPPALSFAFEGGREWAVDAVAFNAGENGNGKCFGALVSYGIQQEGFPVWILGGSFLRNVYSVWDPQGGKIGFADLV